MQSSEKGFLGKTLSLRFPLYEYILFSSICFWNLTVKRSCNLVRIQQEPLECQVNTPAVASTELDILDGVR